MYHRHGLCTAIVLVLWRGCATACAPRSQVAALVQLPYVEQILVIRDFVPAWSPLCMFKVYRHSTSLGDIGCCGSLFRRGTWLGSSSKVNVPN